MARCEDCRVSFALDTAYPMHGKLTSGLVRIQRSPRRYSESSCFWLALSLAGMKTEDVDGLPSAMLVCV